MIADVAGIGFLRELGPMLTAVVLSGYAGASIAAELGTMKVGEEIDALRAIGDRPLFASGGSADFGLRCDDHLPYGHRGCVRGLGRFGGGYVHDGH